jgi:hypothetical protein
MYQVSEVQSTVLKALQMVRGNVLADNIARPAFGICWHFQQAIWSMYPDVALAPFSTALRVITAKWPGYSGSDAYPVEHPDYNDPAQAFEDTDNLWIGVYGQNRMELLEFCIHWLETNKYEAPYDF